MSKSLTPSSEKLLLFRMEGFLDNPVKRSLVKDWFVVRFARLPYPDEPQLINSTLRSPLPFADNSFTSIYAYHVCEHLTIEENIFFLKELHRILKPGGICRLSTPDLVLKAKEYLQNLEAYTADNSAKNYMAYYWGSLTLVDQLARTKSGGRMADAYIGGYKDHSQLKYLFGDTMDYIFDPKVEIYKDNGWKRTYFNGHRASFGFWIKKIVGAALRKLLIKLTKTPLYWWQEREAWVYDSVSLSQIMSEANFESIQVKEYNTSDIADWNKYNFDQSTHGDYAFEPSLFLEGRK